jgi:hypothetical protein
MLVTMPNSTNAWLSVKIKVAKPRAVVKIGKYGYRAHFANYPLQREHFILVGFKFLVVFVDEVNAIRHTNNNNQWRYKRAEDGYFKLQHAQQAKHKNYPNNYHRQADERGSKAPQKDIEQNTGY